MLLFIHGMWGKAEFWRLFINYFYNKGFKCRALELKEGMDLRKVSFADYVGKVKKIVGREDILIGHSLGGLIVQKVAEEKEIKGGVAICSAPPKGIKFPSVVRKINLDIFILHNGWDAIRIRK